MLTHDAPTRSARAPRRWPTRSAATDGWRADVVAGRLGHRRRQRAGVELPTWLVAIEKAGLTPDALEAAAAPADAAGHRAHRARPRAARSPDRAARTGFRAAALIAEMAIARVDPIIGRMIRPFSGWCLAACPVRAGERGRAAAIARRGHVERRRRRTAHLRRAMRLVPRQPRARAAPDRSAPHDAASRGHRSRLIDASCGTAFRARRCRRSPAR